MAELEYPGPGDRVLVLLETGDWFHNGTVHSCDSLGFTVRESWSHSWTYAGFGVTWLWDDGTGRTVDRRILTEADLAVRRRVGRGGRRDGARG